MYVKKFFYVGIVGVVALASGCAKKMAAAPAVDPSAASANAADSQEGTAKPEGDSKSATGVPGTFATVTDTDKAPMFEPLYFDFDSSDFQVGSETSLQSIADYLMAHASATLNSGGHSDERGTEEYNLALADRRARKARDYLVRLGISGARIYVTSYGEERPAVEGDSEVAWSKNRRDEFQVGQK